MKRFLQSWAINTLAVLVAELILKGHIQYQGWPDLVVASLLLGICNAVLRPLLMLLTFPLLLFTLGLFRFVINALLFYFVGFLMRPHFYVDSFRWAFWGALIISLVATILHALTGTGNARVRVEHRTRPPGSSDDDGPVIDI